MKKFNFPLARVLDWRHTQALLEESKLEALHAELRSIDALKSSIHTALIAAETVMKSAPSSTGGQLENFSAFRRHALAEQTRLDALRANCAERAAAQMQALILKRRDVRLLEHLKEKRFTHWQSELTRETDARAEESFLSKWRPR